ncbi:hypothetical protein [Aeromonas hydrophila]|uniref:hypothetical protein n=1 Tax=Aeromonas hydrophila TaxID=644 RepID=UPI00114D2D2E|nr:hypothetical protein [Aeromonas hydrophila]
MEAHRHQIRIEDCTIIYTEGLHYGQRRALWALTLHAEDIEEFQNILSGLSNVTAALPPADRKRWVTA